MAKKTHLKVRMVPESNPDSKFIYYAKKPTKGEKAKEKLKLKKYNPNTRKHEFFIEKKFKDLILTLKNEIYAEIYKDVISKIKNKPDSNFEEVFLDNQHINDKLSICKPAEN